MNSEESIQIALIRLFAGEASPEEKNFIRDWLNLSPENQKQYNNLKEIWLASGVQSNADQYNLEQAIQQFREKISREGNKAGRKIILNRVFRYAAIALLLLALPLAYFTGEKSIFNQTSYTTVTCALGDKTNLILPDSTRVYLNSGTRLVFNNNFNNGDREIILEGEAFFSVTKDKKNPFRVKSPGIEIEVLGTEFNMKAYPDEKQVAVTLDKGSLEATTDNQKTIIKPGQKLVYDNITRKTDLLELDDTSIESEWKEGRFVFRNELLGDLKLKLERWFDVDIVFADETVKMRRFTGILERESILEAVSYFGASRYVGYKIEANKIIFYSKNTN